MKPAADAFASLITVWSKATECPVGSVASLTTVSVAALPALPASSVRVTDRVNVPSPSPDRSRPVIWSVAVAMVPDPVTAVPPPDDETE